MELRILTRLKARDIFDYNMYKSGRHIWAVFGFLFILSLGSVISDRTTLLTALLWLVCPVCTTVYFAFNAAGRARIQPVAETVFNVDGIFSRSRITESYWRYSDITRVIETGKYFYIFIFGAAAFVVPKYQLGSNSNIVFIRNILKSNVSGNKLRLYNNSGEFNDRRKYTFDMEKECALARSDAENVKRYASPLASTVCIIAVIVVFSFYSSYLRQQRGISSAAVTDELGQSSRTEDIDDYIEASERLLVVADDILEIAGNEIVYNDRAQVKYSEISSIENDFYYYYSDDKAIAELDRLNKKLTNRLYEIAGLRIKYAGEDISGFFGELETLRRETVELKEKCRIEIENVKMQAEKNNDEDKSF